jgi:uncharacterized membrane protein
MGIDREQRADAGAVAEAVRDTGRVEAFSDGVFAVAITLLVLNIQVPKLGASATWLSLLVELGKQWPTYLAYSVSFAFILIMWINHHNLFRLIRRNDHNFLIFNGLLLLTVTLVPFPTSLLAAYIQNDSAGRAAAVIYNGTYVLNALAFTLVWRYASHKGRLLDPNVDPRAVRDVHRRYRFGPLIYLVVTAVGVLSPLASVALNALLAVFFALPGRANPVIRVRRDERQPASRDP